MLSAGNHRQTISYLTRRFREVGLEPATRHGQNFLVDLNLVRLLVDRAELTPDDVVLEVGTGTGSLTAMLAERAAAVVTVEVDPRLAQLASEELIDCRNVTQLHLDVLAGKNRLDDRVLAAVRQRLAEAPDRRFKLAANLPYNIATPVISNLLASEPLVHSMTVTIQRELAERIAAPPRCKDYSALSVWVQCQCDVEIVRIMPPSVFWPRPKVESAIVHVAVNRDKRCRIADLEFFHTFIRGLFLHRRKFLRSVLVHAHKPRLDKQRIDELLANLHIDGGCRAEELEVERIIDLADVVRRALTARTRQGESATKGE